MCVCGHEAKEHGARRNHCSRCCVKMTPTCKHDYEE